MKHSKLKETAQKAAKLKLPNFYIATFLKGNKTITITQFCYDEIEMRRYADQEIQNSAVPGKVDGMAYGGYQLAGIATFTIDDLEKGLEAKIEGTEKANAEEKNRIMAQIIKTKDAETLQKMIKHFTPMEVAYMHDQIIK